MALTKKQILALTDEEFEQLSLDEMIRAVGIRAEHRLTQMSPEQVSELAKHFVK